MKIKPFNVIDQTELPAITLDRIPENGDPIEIGQEIYYACETGDTETDEAHKISVIPLVVKNPSRVANIGEYLKCLSIAHRRVQFRKKNNLCDFNECDEMIIS